MEIVYKYGVFMISALGLFSYILICIRNPFMRCDDCNSKMAINVPAGGKYIDFLLNPPPSAVGVVYVFYIVYFVLFGLSSGFSTFAGVTLGFVVFLPIFSKRRKDWIQKFVSYKCPRCSLKYKRRGRLKSNYYY